MQQDYYLYNKEKLLNKHPKKLIGLLIIVFMLSIFFIYFGFTKKIVCKSDNYIIVKKEENNYYGLINLKIEEVKNFKTLGKLEIKKQIRKYKVISISELKNDYLNNQNYQEVIINLRLNKNEKIDNLILPVKLLSKKEKLIYQIINLFK